MNLWLQIFNIKYRHGSALITNAKFLNVFTLVTSLCSVCVSGSDRATVAMEMEMNILVIMMMTMMVMTMVMTMTMTIMSNIQTMWAFVV